MDAKSIVKWFSSIVDSIHNSIIAVDLDCNVIIYNKSCEDFFSVSKQKIIGKNIYGLIPNTKLPQILETKNKISSEQMRINNKIVLTNRAPIFYEGELIGAIAIFNDIDEIIIAKNALEVSETNLEIYKMIFENAYEGIVAIDSDGYITQFNKSYGKFLNVNPADVIGKHVTDVIENTRLHIVAETGEREEGFIQEINGKKIVASRIPIIKDGKIISVVGRILFEEISELESLAKRIGQLKERYSYYKDEIKKMEEAKYSFDSIITQNDEVNHLKKVALQAAHSPVTVIISGESGTGKELFAHGIHKASKRRYGAFVRVNCSAIPKNLLESELFGYEKGAFTGADKKGKPGKFEMANGGTIFLDEIGVMPMEMQAKLLRVLQEKEIQRLGSSKIIDLDIRIIAATNENLLSLVDKNKFRKDLYYRLHVVSIELPPLRQRKDDISLLIQQISKEIAKEYQIAKKEFDGEAIKIMESYNWPGNIRELHNCVERCMHLSSNNLITVEDLPESILKYSNGKIVKSMKLKTAVEKAEINQIKKVLSYCKDNKTEAAKILDIHRTSLYNKLEKYDL
jgi:PAS domain S-box-containing protein